MSTECTFDDKALKVTTMSISVKGNVPGMQQPEFQDSAAEVEKICPMANAIRNNVKIILIANLA